MSAVELTVLVITYNHADFIETAIDSVLMQVTDFQYEVIISEDCSTDGTRQIVERLAQADPDRIQLLLSDRNLRDNTVMRRGLEAVRGRYVALLDGDDFWTSPKKLQTQVDFLKAHPECSSCFHNVNVIYEASDRPSRLFLPTDEKTGLRAEQPKRFSGLAEIVQGDFIPTCSVVFRSHAVREPPPWFDDLGAGDWPLHVVSAEHGEIGYIDEVMGTYRVHPAGLWSMNQSKFLRLRDVEDLVHTYDTFDRHLAFRFKREIAQGVGTLYESAAVALYRRGDYEAARVCARRSLARIPMTRLPRHWRSAAVAVLSRLRFPSPRRRSRNDHTIDGS